MHNFESSPQQPCRADPRYLYIFLSTRQTVQTIAQEFAVSMWGPRSVCSVSRHLMSFQPIIYHHLVMIMPLPLTSVMPIKCHSLVWLRPSALLKAKLSTLVLLKPELSTSTSLNPVFLEGLLLEFLESLKLKTSQTYQTSLGSFWLSFPSQTFLAFVQESLTTWLIFFLDLLVSWSMETWLDLVLCAWQHP